MKMSKILRDKYKFDINDYKIVEKINQGGFGIVYLVENKNTGEHYAAKVNLNNSDIPEDRQKQMNSREIGILIRIQHPTVIRFRGFSYLDFNKNKNITILMDYMKNGSLSSIINKEQQGLCPSDFDNTKRQIILIGICFGMMILHDKHIIHRDLKPENILLDEDYCPCISDFGLSKFLDPQNIMNQSMADFGTASYMAPEVIQSNHFGPKADVYSFGILMYEIIMGCRCYSDMKKIGSFQLKLKVVDGFRPEFKYPIKKGLKKLIERCWSANPSDRPTFTELYNKLSLSSDEFTESTEELLDDDDDESGMQEYCMEDVDVEEVANYIDEIHEMTDSVKNYNDFDDQITTIKKSYQEEIEKMKEFFLNELHQLKETVQKKSDEIQNLNKTIQQNTDEIKMLKDKIKRCEAIFEKEDKIDLENYIEKNKGKSCQLLIKRDENFKDPKFFQLFEQFVENKMCKEYLLFIIDVDLYHNVDEKLIPLMFSEMINKYVDNAGQFHIGIDAATLNRTRNIKIPTHTSFDEMLRKVFYVLDVEIFRSFKQSALYNDYIQKKNSHKSKSKK